MNENRLHVRVYLEDTDAQGIVYHANYLKYFERARSEILRERGFAMDQQGTGKHRFVVHEIRMKFLQAARLDDQLVVLTSVERASEYRMTFHQRVRRQGEKNALVQAEVQVVCVDEKGQLVELPDEIV
jgi:acyl-CoA thioester hydrolase